MQYHSVVLNDSDWLILDVVGDKYFMMAESPLFRGYYSLQPCEYADSRLAAFLTNKYLPQMQNGGVDISKITNMRIPTVGQYMLYIKDKLDPSKTAYILQTKHPRQSDCMLAIDENGEMIAVHVTEQCGIRPCFFADKQYINDLVGTNEDLKPFAEEVTPTETQTDIPVVVPVVDSDEKTNSREETDSAAVSSVVAEHQPTEAEDVVFEEQERDSEELLKEYGDLDEVVAALDGEYDIDEIVSLISDETAAEKPEEVVSTVITESQQTIEVKQIGNTAAVYLFDDYKEFGVLCDNDDAEVKKVISAYGMTIQDFLSASNNANRHTVTKDDVMNRIKQQQRRWRWNS